MLSFRFFRWAPQVVWALPLAAAPVAMVTGVKGPVREGAATVQVMDGVGPGRFLRLGPGARLSLLDLGTGVERVFVGPCRFRLDAKGHPRGAQAASARAVAPAQGPLRLDGASLVSAGFLMRGDSEGSRTEPLGVSPLGPALLEGAPCLSWEDPGPRALTLFRCYDEEGRLRVDTRVQGGRMPLPFLVEGKACTWALEVQEGASRKVLTGTLRVLGARERSQVEAMRPAPGAPFSDRLVFALVLERQGLRDEARRVWGELAQERPEEKRLRAFADLPSPRGSGSEDPPA